MDLVESYNTEYGVNFKPNGFKAFNDYRKNTKLLFQLIDKALCQEHGLEEDEEYKKFLKNVKIVLNKIDKIKLTKPDKTITDASAKAIDYVIINLTKLKKEYIEAF